MRPATHLPIQQCIRICILALGSATSDPFPLPGALPGVGLPGAIATVFPVAAGDFLWTEEMKEQFLLTVFIFLIPFHPSNHLENLRGGVVQGPTVSAGAGI